MVENNNPKWADLLREAIDKPGTVSAAYSAFHNYSFGNQLLAMFQCAGRGIAPGPIATYPGWLAKGRQVQKGAKAITLCMPVTFKVKKENEEGEEEEKDTGMVQHFVYRPNWFVLGQTKPKDGAEDTYEIPAPPAWNPELALTTLEIERIPYDLMDGNAQGYAVGKRLAISPVAANPLKTLVHELAHIVLCHTDKEVREQEQLARSEVEVEAEAVALLILDTLGEDTSNSRGYIQNWDHGKGITEKMAQRIMGAANTILKAGTPAEKN